MAANSNIEWTDHTFNPWVGCSKVSAGFKNCYAETLMDTRYGRVKWGVNGTRSRTSPGNWKLPLRWNREAAAKGIRYRVFCASLADVFEDRPELVQWRSDLFALIDATPNLDWLMLTKRPENIWNMWPDDQGRIDPENAGAWFHPTRLNVWLGTSVEDQEAANARIPHLLSTAHLARFTFLSCEPLLGPVDLSKLWGERCAHCGNDDGEVGRCFCGERTESGIDWVIAGGESGQGARPMHPNWARSLRDQCAAAGVPFLFKQWGEFGTNAMNITTGHEVFRQFTSFEQWVNKADTWVRGGICIDKSGRQLTCGKDMAEARDNGTFPVTIMHKMGKKKAGRLLDGIEHNGFPDQQPEPVRA